MDSSDHALHLACRAGETEKVRFLVDVCAADINVADAHDAPPLYHAALGGHAEICRFLLDRGARCEPDTYDGERVFYAALNDELRALLRAYKLSARSRDPFAEHVRRACADVHFADVVFELGER